MTLLLMPHSDHVCLLSAGESNHFSCRLECGVPVADLSFMAAYGVVSALSQQLAEEHSNYNTHSSFLDTPHVPCCSVT